MYAERLGSYSISATRAGTPSLRRLKSILRYSRLAPPPRWREVLRPRELRPPDFFRPSVSDFSGSDLVRSAKSEKVAKRRPGDVGLGLRIGIRRSLCPLQALEDRDRLALANLDDGFLPPPGAPEGLTAPLGLRLDHRGPYLNDTHVEELLDRLADLGLVRPLVDAEGVLPDLCEHVGLLRDDRPDDYLAWVHQ